MHSAEFTIRITREIKAEIELAAAEERRSLGAVARNVLVDWAARRMAKRARKETAPRSE
jgi:hypothetical protein